MLQDAGGSLSTLLNEPMPGYDAQPKVKTKLQVAKELVRRSLMEAMRHRDVLNSPASVRDYLRMTLAGRDYEVFMVLFLDAQNRVFASEEMFRGTLTQTSVYPREVVKRASRSQRGGRDLRA
jgi:DNA repair protein RadC